MSEGQFYKCFYWPFVKLVSGKLNNKFKNAKKESPVVPKVAELMLSSVSKHNSIQLIMSNKIP